MKLKMNIQLFGGNGNSSTGKRSSGSGTQKLTQDEQNAIEYYASGDGMGINNLLRGRYGFTENDLDTQDRKIIKDLDSALNHNVGEQILYRSVDASAVFGNISDTDFENLRDELNYNTFSKGKGNYSKIIANKTNDIINSATDKSFVDKGYVSTTRDLTIAENWGGFTGSDRPIVMKIKTSNKTKGADISKATKHLRQIESQNPQKETLLARNQKFKVDKIYGRNGLVYVEVKM